MTSVIAKNKQNRNEVIPLTLLSELPYEHRRIIKVALKSPKSARAMKLMHVK